MTKEYLNEHIETASTDELRHLQQEKAMKQLDYLWAYSTFYQKKFGDAGIDRRDIKTLDDFSLLPFTEKEELRKSQEDQPPLGLHGVTPIEEVIRVHSSSGTTGVPTFVGITRHDHEVWTNITARSLFTEGIRKTDKVIQAAGLTFFVGGLPVKDAVEHIGAAFIPIGTGASDRVIMTTRRLGANVLHCTPSYAMYLAEYCRKKHNLNPAELGYDKVVVGAEPGGGVPAIRRKLEEEFGAIVTEGLGNSDAAPIVFGECPEKQGMHFCAQEYIYCELIEPDTGKPIQITDGAEGELVYSLIDRESCPVIRFRTRDRISVFTDPCACGRTSFRVRCVGRTDDMLIILGVNVFPSAIKDVVASFQPRTTGDMLIHVDQPIPKVDPPLKIQVEYTDPSEDLSGLKRELEQALRDKLLFKADLDLVAEGTLPRHEMKAQLIKKGY